MRQKIFIVGLLVFLFVSCKKNKNTSSISGLYTENSPIAGRSQLNFISDKFVIKSEIGNNYNDTFSFSIAAGKILLTPVLATQNPGQQFEFEKIDDNTFKIENLYPSIPETAKSYMIFKK